MTSLTLLGEPAWDGRRISGDRSIDLLAALALAGDRGATVDRLVAELWPDAEPANAAKALQVVVSRARKATTADAIERWAQGYRLASTDVDAGRLDGLAQLAGDALQNGELAAAIERSGEACRMAILDDDGTGSLARLRRGAKAHQRQARRVLGLALARTGARSDALPVLLDVHGQDPSDDEVLGELLLAEAAVKGPGAALGRYETHRADLSERLGIDPSEDLQRVHAQLLLADRPQRHGVRFDADDLVGRDGDLSALLGLVTQHRVVTILGPGGLGKTRMAQMVARHAPQPVVHVVELVGVRSGEDVAGEVGSVLGVRDSVTTVNTLTPAQRADLRTRIAALLDRSPALLVLDNCEHVVDSVAELVSFLVASTRDLRVVTTSRSPLAVSVERVYPLATLDDDDASRLFELRAVAVRPGVTLDAPDVHSVVAQLDGLPLAIELAAAKTRVMSVKEIGRRLSNRFELLRGGDRSAPDRHQTLLAVIDWSWSLLGEAERRALRRLSVFSDGFTLDSAEVLLGATALDDVTGLVDQSLLVVTEEDGALRYRMLETVREFGRMHLVESGEDVEAEATQRRWAMDFVATSRVRFFSTDQPAEVARLLREETNLSDVLRRSLTAGDGEAAVELMAALGTLWTIRGEHARVMMLTSALNDVLTTYRPTGEHADAARVSAALVSISAVIMGNHSASGAVTALQALGPGDDPNTASLVRVMAALTTGDESERAATLRALMDHPERVTRALALRWAAQAAENEGDTGDAVELVERALSLWQAEDGIWTRAMHHMTLSQLAAQRGELGVGAQYAELALPDLLSLSATDDVIDARAIIALRALRDGDLTTATALVELNSVGAQGPWIFGGTVVNLAVQAEVELAQGQVADGLATYRRMAAALQRPVPGIDLESGLEPWTLYGVATAAAAHGLRGTGEDLYDDLLTRLPAIVRGERLDYPVLGVVLFAVGLCGLQLGRLKPATATALLELAERFSYIRVSPSLSWDIAMELVEQADATDDLASWRSRFGSRRGAQLLDETRTLVEQLST